MNGAGVEVQLQAIVLQAVYAQNAHDRTAEPRLCPQVIRINAIRLHQARIAQVKIGGVINVHPAQPLEPKVRVPNHGRGQALPQFRFQGLVQNGARTPVVHYEKQFFPALQTECQIKVVSPARFLVKARVGGKGGRGPVVGWLPRRCAGTEEQQQDNTRNKRSQPGPAPFHSVHNRMLPIAVRENQHRRLLLKNLGPHGRIASALRALTRFLLHLGVAPAVAEINHKPDGHPDNQPRPGVARQAAHQEDTGADAQR